MAEDNSGDMGNPISSGPNYGEQIPPPPGMPPSPYPNQYYSNQGPYPYQYKLPNDKHAVMAMVFGILGLTSCGFFAPAGLILGMKSQQRIKESNGTLGGEGMALTGFICGIIGTVFLALAAIYFIFWLLVVGGIVIGGS